MNGKAASSSGSRESMNQQASPRALRSTETVQNSRSTPRLALLGQRQRGGAVHGIQVQADVVREERMVAAPAAQCDAQRG